MRRSLVPAVLAVALVACASQPAAPPEPITVFTNAKIFTSDRANLWAEAIAVQGDRIVAVGASSDVLAAAQQRSTVIDVHNLEGRVVVPGFNDAHFHSGTYPKRVSIEVSGMDPGVDEVLAKLRDAVNANPAGTWLTAEVGGHVLNEAAVTRSALDAISTAHPILLASWAGHGYVANSPALEALGYGDATRDPMGGALGRTADGLLNGQLDEYAGYAAARNFGALTPLEERVEGYARTAAMFTSLGITSVQDFATMHPPTQKTRYLEQAGVPLRWRVIRFPLTTPTSFGAGDDRGPVPEGSRAGAKWIIDGTPVERGAAMTSPYRDDPTTRGTLNFSRETIAEMLEAADGRGEQPMFHTVGDEAIDAVLDAMDATGGAARWNGKRVRLEHGDMITAAQLGRARDSGIVYVQNPSHLSLVEMMRTRYAPRADIVQPLKSVLGAGVPLAIGSDGPPNPFLNIMFATTHPTTPSEALTREEAVIAYTYGSAYAEFAEEEKGTLTVGKLADLAVLDADIFTIPPDQLPRVKSTLTMIGGKVVGPPARRP